MDVKVDPEDILKQPTDNRGRIYLGSEYANKTVEIAVLEVDSKE